MASKRLSRLSMRMRAVGLEIPSALPEAVFASLVWTVLHILDNDEVRIESFIS
jgi:hypothetical protein